MIPVALNRITEAKRQAIRAYLAADVTKDSQLDIAQRSLLYPAFYTPKTKTNRQGEEARAYALRAAHNAIFAGWPFHPSHTIGWSDEARGLIPPPRVL